MTHKFDRAEVRRDDNGNWLCLHIKNAPMARNECDNLKDGKTYQAVIKPDTRSLDANAFYWALNGRLAAVLNISPEELYRQHIREFGNYDIVYIETKAVRGFAERWCGNHTGRMIDTRKSKIPGCTTVLAYYGSSDFDTAQMSRLIDNCIQDCEAVGVETASPAEIARMKEEWR